MKSRKSLKSQLKITSLEIMRLANELQKFVGKRIDNIYHDDGSIFLKISSKNGIEIHKNVIFASQGFESKNTNFSQLLRKHLKGRKIMSIEQHGFDRIVVIKFPDRIVVAELFHSGNVILCDSEWKIIAALDQRHWKDRSLVPGTVYRFPASIDITNYESFSSVDSDEKTVSFLVKNGLGFHAEDVLERCVIKKDREFKSLSEEEKKSIYSEIMSFLKRGSETDFIMPVMEKEEFSVEDKRKIAMEKMQKKEAELRAKAEKIYEKFAEISEMKGGEIEIDGMKIKLNRALSIEKNAGRYFNEAKKLHGKIERAAAIQVKEKNIESKPEKREWYHKFRWFFTNDNFLVVAGRDAKTNNDLIRKHLESTDVVVHAEIHGAAFAVVKSQKKSVAKDAIDEAMQFAACHSKAWAMGLGTIDVYWVKPEQLKSGLGTGTFNVVGEKNYIRRMELKMGAGFVKDEFQILPHKTFEHLGIKCVPIYTGDIKSKDLAKKIKEKLKALYIDKAKEIDGMPLSEIESRIPYGRGSV